jgi:spore coat polysaccharide biosynthesis predicted glycosyltransferase SpsG
VIILFRIVAGHLHGFGHFRRVLALAENLPPDCVCHVLVPGADASVRTAAKHAGLSLIDPVPVDNPDEEQQQVRTALNADPALVVFDMATGEMAADPARARALIGAYQKSGAPCAWIDASAPYQIVDSETWPIDLLIAPYTTTNDYPGWTGARSALGAHYAVIRPEVSRLRQIRSARPHAAEHLVVTLGGADPCDMTQAVLRALLPIAHHWARITVVIGPAFSGKARRTIHALASRNSTNIEVLENPPHLPELIAASDLTITGGGTTKYELACLGTPMIVLPHDRPHQIMSSALVERVKATMLPVSSATQTGRLRARLMQAQKNRSWRFQTGVRGQREVDGRGIQRLTERLVQAAQEGRT